MTVTRSRLDALDLDRAQRAFGSTREGIALAVLRIVATYAGEPADAEATTEGTVTRRDGESLAEAAERRVRDLAEAAEANCLPGGGYGRTRVVSETLIDEYLFEDYLRIKRGEQHLAFDED